MQGWKNGDTRSIRVASGYGCHKATKVNISSFSLPRGRQAGFTPEVRENEARISEVAATATETSKINVGLLFQCRPHSTYSADSERRTSPE